MSKRIPGQISLFDYIREYEEAKKLSNLPQNPFPKGTIVINNDGIRMTVVKARYVEIYDDYRIEFSTGEKTGFLGSWIYAKRAMEDGYQIIKRSNE